MHLAASQLDLVGVLKFCIQQDHKIDALNDDLCTPLHFAVQGNNMHGAALLIEHSKLRVFTSSLLCRSS